MASSDSWFMKDKARVSPCLRYFVNKYRYLHVFDLYGEVWNPITVVRNYIQTSFSSCAHFPWKNRHFQICYQTYCAFIFVVIWLRDHDDTSSSKCEFGGATWANHNHTSYIWTTYFRHSFNVECVSCVVHGHITVERWENLFNISCAVTSCHSCRPSQ